MRVVATSPDRRRDVGKHTAGGPGRVLLLAAKRPRRRRPAGPSTARASTPFICIHIRARVLIHLPTVPQRYLSECDGPSSGIR